MQERAIPDAVLAAAVRDALEQDSDGDGVPDLLDRPDPPIARFEPAPAAPKSSGAGGAIVVGVLALAGLGGAFFYLTSRGPAPVAEQAHRPARSSAPIATPSPVSPPTVTPTASSKTAKPAVKMTNEQYGKSRIAAVHPKILSCVEQDLLRNPSVPKAYSVTVLVEKDGLPKNSATTFSPTPTKGFQSCASTAISYAFDRAAPNPGEFTFTTGFAFPAAKPAAKAEYGRGWD